MSQDFFINPATDDWYLENGTTIRLCKTEQELIRQRILINLSVVRGEWFANINYGVPYFTTVYGKDTKDATDAVFRTTIRNTEGVISILKFQSEVNKETRTYTLTFTVETLTGDIEVTI